MDAGASDGAADDGGREPCAISMPLPTQGAAGDLLGIERGQALDIDGDGLDEVVLITESNRAPEVFLHLGKCPITRPWDYQQLWQPEGKTPGFAPYGLAFVEGRSEANRVALIGQEGNTPAVATYLVTEGAELPAKPDTVEIIPDFLGGSPATCQIPTPPYYLMSGNLDVDIDVSRNDLVFFAKQGWIHRVDQWSVAPAFDVVCESGVYTSGSVPDRYSGPGDRFGYQPVQPAGTDSDEFVDVRDNRAIWYFDGGNDTGVVENWAIDGAAFSRLAVPDDGRIDFVAWTNGSTLTLHTASLINQGTSRDISVSVQGIDIGGAPSFGAVIDVRGQQRLLLGRGDQLRLIGTPETAPSVVSSVNLAFSPKFVLTPNWGPGGTPIVLAWDSDNGSFACYRFSGSGEFEICPE